MHEARETKNLRCFKSGEEENQQQKDETEFFVSNFSPESTACSAHRSPFRYGTTFELVQPIHRDRISAEGEAHWKAAHDTNRDWPHKSIYMTTDGLLRHVASVVHVLIPERKRTTKHARSRAIVVLSGALRVTDICSNTVRLVPASDKIEREPALCGPKMTDLLP